MPVPAGVPAHATGDFCCVSCSRYEGPLARPGGERAGAQGSCRVMSDINTSLLSCLINEASSGPSSAIAPIVVPIEPRSGLDRPVAVTQNSFDSPGTLFPCFKSNRRVLHHEALPHQHAPSSDSIPPPLPNSTLRGGAGGPPGDLGSRTAFHLRASLARGSRQPPPRWPPAAGICPPSPRRPQRRRTSLVRGGPQCA